MPKKSKKLSTDKFQECGCPVEYPCTGGHPRIKRGNETETTGIGKTFLKAIVCLSCETLKEQKHFLKIALESMLEADFGCGCCSMGNSAEKAVKQAKKALEATKGSD